MKDTRLDQRGFTLPELLISTLFVLWFGAMLHEFHRTVLHSVRLQEDRAWAQDTVRTAMEVLSRELRLAGYQGGGTPLVALRGATSQQIAIQADFNGDGDTSDPHERITYLYDAGRGALMRATGNAPPQPMVDHVPAEAFFLRYRDANGGHLAGELSADALAAVRQVDIQLGTQYTNPHPAFQAPIVVMQTATVELRNGAR